MYKAFLIVQVVTVHVVAARTAFIVVFALRITLLTVAGDACESAGLYRFNQPQQCIVARFGTRPTYCWGASGTSNPCLP